MFYRTRQLFLKKYKNVEVLYLKIPVGFPKEEMSTNDCFPEPWAIKGGDCEVVVDAAGLSLLAVPDLVLS